MAGRRVLITGVGGYLGSELARRLDGDPDVAYVAGLDTAPPLTGLGRTEFIEADIRDPGLARMVAPLEVDTVVHNKIVRRPGPGMSADAAHDVNVMGSLQLIAACEATQTVRAIVVRGSAGIYGAEPTAPQFFTEDMARLYPLRTRFQRDVGEIERYFEAYARRHPAVTCTMLRYQPAIGPSVDSQVTRYLSLPAAPTFLGFDPRVQFVHESDALGALVAAVRRPVKGAVNVAGEGTVGVTRMVRLARRPTLPIPSPLFDTAVAAGARAGFPSLSEDFRRLLRYGRAVDVTRLIRDVGYRPRYSTPDAVLDYAGSRAAPNTAAPPRPATAQP